MDLQQRSDWLVSPAGSERSARVRRRSGARGFVARRTGGVHLQPIQRDGLLIAVSGRCSAGSWAWRVLVAAGRERRLLLSLPALRCPRPAIPAFPSDFLRPKRVPPLATGSGP